MGMELRIREPSAEGVAPLRLLCADLSVGEDAAAFLAGVSRTSFRNWELFMVMLWCLYMSHLSSPGQTLGSAFSLVPCENFSALSKWTNQGAEAEHHFERL
jgi:hypothetical protein